MPKKRSAPYRSDDDCVSEASSFTTSAANHILTDNGTEKLHGQGGIRSDDRADPDPPREGGRHTFGVRSGIKLKGKMNENQEESEYKRESSSEESSGSRSSKRTSKKKKRDLQNDILLQLGQLTTLMQEMMHSSSKKSGTRKTRRCAGSSTTTEQMTDQSLSTDSEVILRHKQKKEAQDYLLKASPTKKEESEESIPSQFGESTSKETSSQIKKNYRLGEVEPPITQESPQRSQPAHVNTRPKIMPDKYDGTSDWNEYASHFDTCREINAWSQEEAAQFLAASLRGQALRLLEEQRSMKWSYEEIKRRLSTRFSSAKQAESYLLELRHRKRRPNESLQELGRSIRELTCRAYPDFDNNGVDRLAKIHFADAIINQEIRTGIFHSKANTLDEMIQAAITTEAFLQTELHRSGWKRNTHNRVLNSGTESAGPPNIEEIINKSVDKAVDQAMRRIEQKMTPQSYSQSSPSSAKVSSQAQKQEVQCFYCNKKGHFRRDCRQRVADLRQDNRRQDERRPQAQEYHERLNGQWSPQRAMTRPNTMN